MRAGGGDRGRRPRRAGHDDRAPGRRPPPGAPAGRGGRRAVAGLGRSRHGRDEHRVREPPTASRPICSTGSMPRASGRARSTPAQYGSRPTRTSTTPTSSGCSRRSSASRATRTGRTAMARVLITGCSTGFGRATAVELTKRGHEVLATARRPETIDDLDVTDKLRLDVDDDASVADAVASAGQVDALVNNAGFGISGPDRARATAGVPADVRDERPRRPAHDPGRAAPDARTGERHDRQRDVARRPGDPADRWGVLGDEARARGRVRGTALRGRALRHPRRARRARVLRDRVPGQGAALRSRRAAVRRARQAVADGVREAPGRWSRARRRAGCAGDRRRGGGHRAEVALADRRRRRHGAVRARSTMDDETFEATMRGALDLTW